MDSCSDLDLDLVPGLPNELVASRILPLLPWYARPVCRAISTSWKSLIDAARDDPVLIDATRAAQIPLLRGALVLCVKSNHSWVFKFADRFHKRDLPPFHNRDFPRDRPLLVAGSGKIFAWTGWVQTRSFKLDVGRGDWHWQRVTTPIVSLLGSMIYPIVLGSKIYATCNSPKPYVAVIDMESDDHEKIPMWGCWDAGSVVSPRGVEDLYGFRDGDAGLVEVVRYDQSSNSWSTQERITRITRASWVRSFMVVNGSCFEPAMETGINVLWLDIDTRQLWWRNSTVCNDEEWIPIDCDALQFQWRSDVVRPSLEMYVIRGSLYGWDMDRSTLGKGKIVVESKRVIWEPLLYVSDTDLHGVNLLV